MAFEPQRTTVNFDIDGATSDEIGCDVSTIKIPDYMPSFEPMTPDSECGDFLAYCDQVRARIIDSLNLPSRFFLTKGECLAFCINELYRKTSRITHVAESDEGGG